MLLLPAVQAAREAARRAHCVNNLKQIALAIANYVDINQSTPVHEYRYAAEGGVGFAGCHSWYCGILPYMEQSPMYNRLNQDYTQEWIYSGPLTVAARVRRLMSLRSSTLRKLLPKNLRSVTSG